ncbi:MAG: hypothetical protein KC505_08350 [Myxococcales bacterium]|nr:hypothetical protein [Myxococcales bacterium]USN51099.1 MAG: hypothetical protein H6731_01435 [Myxococcales bacterium]
MATKTRKRRSTFSFKDVEILYLVEGLSPIIKLHKDKKVSPATIRRAVGALRSVGKVESTLENWVNENLRVGSRGRAAPKIGQERVYRAQQINESGPFLRLPLGALKALKGDALSVSFEKDCITVSKRKN